MIYVLVILFFIFMMWFIGFGYERMMFGFNQKYLFTKESELYELCIAETVKYMACNNETKKIITISTISYILFNIDLKLYDIIDFNLNKRGNLNNIIHYQMRNTIINFLKDKGYNVLVDYKTINGWENFQLYKKES